ncbi:MAG: 6-hydroxymethylpterin diphosphokinase MptE-like protein [Halieaceae bacterium]
MTSQKSESIESWASGAAISGAEAAIYREQAVRLNQRLDVLKEWISQVVSQFSTEELLSSSAGVQLFLDHSLPGVWDFSQDIAVLHGAERSVLQAALVARGQKKIVVIDPSPEYQNDQRDNPKSSIEFTRQESSFDLVRFRSGSSPDTEQFSVMLGEEIPSIALIGDTPDAEADRDFERIFKSVSAVLLGKKSVKEWPVIFTHQWLARLTDLAGIRSVASLKSQFKGQNILIASPGPSLYQSLSALKDQRNQFLVISPIRSLLTLLEAGITPDFAFHVDATDFSRIIPKHAGLSQVPLICTDYAHSSVFDAGFKEIYSVPDPAMVGNSISDACHGASAPVLQGGCVATCAVGLAAQFEVNSITLVGQDLSISRGRYVRQAEGDISGGDVDESDDDYLTCQGIDGERLRTQEDYLWFIGEMENAARLFSPEIRFVNSTAHGAYLEGWEHTVLENHPLTSDSAKRQTPPTYGNADEDVSSRQERIIRAIKTEKEALREAARLCSDLVALLGNLIETQSNDVTEVDAAEERLSRLLSAKGSILRFYTSRFSMALEAASKSVTNLTENLIISAEYYRLIGPRAEKLAGLLEASLQKLQGELMNEGRTIE